MRNNSEPNDDRVLKIFQPDTVKQNKLTTNYSTGG